MDKDGIRRFVCEYIGTSENNRVARDIAIRPELAGMRMFDEPLAGFAAADDPYFAELQNPGVVGPHFRLPTDWLPTAKTVVSFFFPMTEQVRKSNVPDLEWPSHEWMHARIEGHKCLAAMAKELAARLEAEGHAAVVPTASPEFWSRDVPTTTDADGTPRPGFTSNWSERHVAHVAGLGTFGLSAGLITAKGMAGRFISLVTELPLEADARPYEKWDEYCTHCGACIPRCSFLAIDERGKDHLICGAISARNKARFKPWYGCGKCQVRVPCETRIPGKRK